MLLMENKFQPAYAVFRSFLVLFSILLFCSSATATFNNALMLYEKKNYPEAFYAFKNLAYIGDKSSQFNLGVMYFRGEHVEKDMIEAYSWMHVASEDGNEKFLRLKNLIYKKFSEKEQYAARTLSEEYIKTYGNAALATSLAPKPLSDEDCAPAPKLLDITTPKFPAAQSRQGQLGYVEIIVNISPQGYARDISMRKVTDGAFFKAAAKSAISSRWETKSENGYFIPQSGAMFRFSFLAHDESKLVTSVFEEKAKEKLEKAEGGDIKSQYFYAQTLDAARILKLEIKDLDVEYQRSNEWYMKSAKSGHPLAQYELGKNILAGRGCEADRETGLKWLRAAALAGHPYAQEEIAMSTINDGVSDAERAMFWLRKAANSTSYPPKLFLAWELAANPSMQLRDGNEALELLAIKPEYYYDDVRIFETKAAAYAQLGDFKKAIKWQLKANKKASKLGWSIAVMQQRLATYEKGQQWTGAYHVPELLTQSEQSI